MQRGVLLAVGILIPVAAWSQSADVILDRMQAQMQGESSRAEMTMTIERPRYTREIGLRTWALGQDYTMTLVTYPPRDEGTVYLKRENEIWNYVPTIDRTIKLPPSMMSQSWMGSDFTNDDLVRESSLAEDYEAEIVRSEQYDGLDAWVLSLVPLPDTPVVWGRVLLWVEKQDYLQLRAEYMDQEGQLVDILALSDIREMDGRRLPARLELTPADDPGHRTVLTYDSIEFGVDLDESFFSRQMMSRVR